MASRFEKGGQQVQNMRIWRALVQECRGPCVLLWPLKRYIAAALHWRWLATFWSKKICAGSKQGVGEVRWRATSGARWWRAMLPVVSVGWERWAQE
ncbi:hypothetical protein KCP69_24040 [Salmonella enterica subsp. enterica]|nr:hypothetical protein KCP69_24040 [Salmonella enterica subsp. enterica]